jgi:hypothetical protein
MTLVGLRIKLLFRLPMISSLLLSLSLHLTDSNGATFFFGIALIHFGFFFDSSLTCAAGCYFMKPSLDCGLVADLRRTLAIFVMSYRSETVLEVSDAPFSFFLSSFFPLSSFLVLLGPSYVRPRPLSDKNGH